MGLITHVPRVTMLTFLHKCNVYMVPFLVFRVKMEAAWTSENTTLYGVTTQKTRAFN